MKHLFLRTLLLIALLSSALISAPLQPVLAGDNCCGANGQNCSSDQEWQNGWNACNNNACPGYAGCSKGSAPSGGGESSGSGSSGSNICGAGGAQGCAGKPVGYIMTVGTERLKCFKQTAQSTTCGRQYVDSAGNYTSGSDNSSAGCGNNCPTPTPQPGAATRCASGSADHCTGEAYGTTKTIPGTNTIIVCLKRENSDRCKRNVVQNNATPDQVTNALPDTGAVCGGPNTQCRKSSDSCQRQGAVFRCLATTTTTSVAAVKFHLTGSNLSDLKCERSQNCSGASCFETSEMCQSALSQRRANLEIVNRCNGVQGKIVSCNHGTYCLPAVAANTSCEELKTNNAPPTTKPEDLKKLCQNAGMSNLAECQDNKQIIVRENGRCGGSDRICAAGLECLVVSGDAPNRSCRRPPQLPDQNQIITVYSNETGACVSRQIRRSEASFGVRDFENPAECARSLTAIQNQYKLLAGGNNANPSCLAVSTACAAGDTCFGDQSACQEKACELSAARLSCGSSSSEYVCEGSVARCRTGSTILQLSEGQRCISGGAHESCVCTIGAVKIPLTKGESRVCSVALVADQSSQEEQYAQQGDLCGQLQCDPTKSLVCGNPPNIAEYADLPGGARVCLGSSDVAAGRENQVCQLLGNGTDTCGEGLECLRDFTKPPGVRICMDDSLLGPDTTQEPSPSLYVGEEQEGWRPVGVSQPCHRCASSDLRADCPFTSQAACAEGSSVEALSVAKEKLIRAEICEAPDGSLHTEVCKEGLVCRREGNILSSLGLTQPSGVGRCSSPIDVEALTVNQDCTNNASLCTDANLTCMNDPLVPNRKICQLPSKVKAEGESCNPLVGRVGCQDGLVCTQSNQTGFRCERPNSLEASCSQKGIYYQLCSAENSAGEVTRSCVNMLTGSCAQLQQAVENNLVGPSERRWKLAVNQGSCIECRAGESRDLCRYSSETQCGSIQTGLNTSTYSQQLGLGEVCQSQNGALNTNWCRTGLVCAPIKNDLGRDGIARCQSPDSVTAAFVNSPCGRVGSTGQQIPDHGLCPTGACLYDGSRNGYVCKAPDTEIPESNRRVISLQDQNRVCWDKDGCFCQVGSGDSVSTYALSEGASCPVPFDQSCTPDDQQGSSCGENGSGTCVYLNDGGELTCKNVAEIEIENDQSAASCTALCNCSSSQGNVTVNYCQPSGMTCQSVCTSPEVQARIAEKESEQRQIAARAVEAIRQTLQNGLQSVTTLYSSITKAGRVATTTTQLDQAALEYQVQNESQQGPLLMPRGVRCDSGLECQSGICTSNSLLSQSLNVTAVDSTTKFCADSSDLLPDGGRTCHNDAACKSGKCSRGVCESSQYTTPQLLVGQRCPAEAGLGCLCRLPDGNTVSVNKNDLCLVPISGTCTAQAQCDGVGVCQPVSATRSECVASQSEAIMPTLIDRVSAAAAQGNPLKETGSACASGVECMGGFCVDHDSNTATAKQCSVYDQLLNSGASCTSPGQCQSGSCQNFVCTNSEQKKIVFPGEVCTASAGCQCRGDEESLPTALEIGEGARCLVAENEVCSLQSQCSDGFLCVANNNNQPRVCRNPSTMIPEELSCSQAGRKFCSQCWNAYNFQVSASSSDPSIPHPGQAPNFCVGSQESCSCPNIPGGS